MFHIYILPTLKFQFPKGDDDDPEVYFGHRHMTLDYLIKLLRYEDRLLVRKILY